MYIKKLFEVGTATDKLQIKLINDLTCDLWGSCWGEASELIRSYNENTPVEIYFSKCFVADPFALMNLILDLKDVKDELHKEITIIFPFLDFNKENKEGYRLGAFLKYLATQGFLTEMCQLFSVKYGKNPINSATIKKFSSYSYLSVFSGEVVFPLKIFNLTEEECKDDIVNDVLNYIQFKLINHVSTHTYRVIKEQIYNIIVELVENSYRHAYENKINKNIAIYIRRRKGLTDLADQDTSKQIVERDKNYEKKNCPGTNDNIYVENSAFLEIFFSDIGMGLTASLREYFKGKKKEYKYPVRELFEKVLKEGMRKDASKSITPFGGLHFICRIVNENRGYIWCNEGGEWVGAFANELLSDGSEKSKTYLTQNRNFNQTRGLNWCFRIPFCESISEQNNFAESWNGIPELHPVYLAFMKRSKELYINDTVCIDEKMQTCTYLNGDYKTWIETSIDKMEESPEFTKDIVVIWLPKGNLTKNDITRLTQQYCSAIASKLKRAECGITLIIGDVDQDRLFSYYYTLNMSRIKEFPRIRRILIISKMWEVISLENRDERFRADTQRARNFLRNSSEDTSIGFSLINYALFMRTWDSFAFWKKVKRLPEKNIYINSQIMWGSNKINGYLDLENAYLQPELYEIIENALLRTKGFAMGSSVEYRSLDQTAVRVCQNLNSQISIEDGAVVEIEVCGASVTGYTAEAAFREVKSSMAVLFFAHPVFSKEIEMSTLFVWPKEEFFSDLKRNEDGFYYRLGKTSLISKKKDNALIDTTKIYDSTVRNKKQMYEDFQNEIPQIIRYGHYKTDMHHYLIGFDIISYIKYSYLKKEGAFAYFLWKIVYYLVGEDYTSVLPLLKDKEWIDTLGQAKYKKDSNHGALVIYHSNTYMEYIMKMMATILPDNVLSCIVPVNVYEVQAKGSPITFSPLILDQIASTFAGHGKRGILFIDSSISTGRRMIEIENLLLSTGCEKVIFLSLLDMRRLISSDRKNTSYWKVNVPRLDDDGHCIICETMKKIPSLLNRTKSEYQGRIIEWTQNWTCMNINNSVGNHGIGNIRDLNCDFNGIKVTDSVALNLILAETLCESYSSDYVYRFISQKTDLQPTLRMQLICTQIALYGNQNSRQLQLTLLGELIKLLSKEDTLDSYGSLAALILLSQNSHVIYELVYTILNTNDSKPIEIIRSAFLQSTNEDLALVFAHHVAVDNELERLISGYRIQKGESFPFIDQLNGVLSINRELKQIFKDFEGIYVNEMGNRHSTNWQKLLKEHVTDYSQFEIRCNKVINDISQMIRLVRKFPLAMMNSRGNATAEVDKIDESFRGLKLKIRNQLAEYKNKTESGEKIEQYIISDDVKQVMLELDRYFGSISEYYFITYSQDTISYLRSLIAKAEETYNKRISFSSDIEKNFSGLDRAQKYYYWNQGIEKEFEYLLQNVEHCTENIASDQDKPQMQVSVHFGLSELLIELKSLSETTGEQIKDAFLRKNRMSKEQAISFDVLFDFESTDYNEDLFLLNVKMAVPACYQILKGDKNIGK